jgi:hypothetical protein
MADIREDGEVASVASAVPTNAMGGSSSTPGSGGVATFDPLMKFKKKRLSDIMLRRPLKAMKANLKI